MNYQRYQGALPLKPKPKRIGVEKLIPKIRPRIADMPYNTRFSVESLNRYNARYGDIKQVLHVLEREGLIYREPMDECARHDWKPKYWRRR